MKSKRMTIIVLACVYVLFLTAESALADDTTDDDWVTSSGNTYVTSGNVGIGTTSPGQDWGGWNNRPGRNLYRYQR